MPSENASPLSATRSSLLSRVRDLDDSVGWAEFDKLYRPLLTLYARHRGLGLEEAEEIAQQCLAAIAGRMKKFKRQSSFRGWLRGMVDHKVSDYLAERARNHRADTDLLRQTPDRNLSPVEMWQLQWDQAHLRYLLACLRGNFPSHVLQAFTMYVLLERGVDEISHLLGLTPNQVYVSKSRVLRCIRERFPDLLESLYGVTP